MLFSVFHILSLLLQNGGLSSLPYVVMFITTIVGGQVVDRIREKKIVSDTVVRKTVQAIGR